METTGEIWGLCSTLSPSYFQGLTNERQPHVRLHPSVSRDTFDITVLTVKNSKHLHGEAKTNWLLGFFFFQRLLQGGLTLSLLSSNSSYHLWYISGAGERVKKKIKVDLRSERVEGCTLVDSLSWIQACSTSIGLFRFLAWDISYIWGFFFQD